MDFEWDPRKAEFNLQKHGVSFTEAGSIFGDELAITVPDPDHSNDEERFITIGWSNQRRLLMVSHTDRNDRIRIINARELTKAERKEYEEENRI
jgi:uncharacterized DUF497 family protein